MNATIIASGGRAPREEDRSPPQHLVGVATSLVLCLEPGDLLQLGEPSSSPEGSGIRPRTVHSRCLYSGGCYKTSIRSPLYGRLCVRQGFQNLACRGCCRCGRWLALWLAPLEARPPCTSWPCRTRPSASGAYRLPKAVAVRPCRLALMLVPRGGVMRATDRRCLASCLCTGFLVAPVVAIAPAVLAAPPAGGTVVSAVLADAVQGCRDWDYSCGYRRGVRQARSDAGKDCGNRHRRHDDRSTTTRSEDGYSKGYLDGSLAYCPPAGSSDETFPYNP
jgi:hypothetical protein